jgi:hypothetical protein
MCEHKFYLLRLAGWKIDDAQGLPAALGCAVDMLVKNFLARKLGKGDEPRFQLINLEKNINREHRENTELLAVAQNLAQLYVDKKFAQRSLDEGLIDLELDIHQTFQNMSSHVQLRGLPDGVIENPKPMIARYMPWDIKVRGYKSKQGYSPTPGYRIYVTSDGKSMDAHPKAGMPLEDLNYNWAVQMTIYSWLLNDCLIGVINESDLPVAIDEFTFGAKSIVLTQIRTTIKKEFARRVWYEILECWNWCNRDFDKDGNPMYFATPDRRKCYSYNQLCGVAPYCKAYQDSLGDPDMAILG